MNKNKQMTQIKYWNRVCSSLERNSN